MNNGDHDDEQLLKLSWIHEMQNKMITAITLGNTSVHAVRFEHPDHTKRAIEWRGYQMMVKIEADFNFTAKFICVYWDTFSAHLLIYLSIFVNFRSFPIVI